MSLQSDSGTKALPSVPSSCYLWPTSSRTLACETLSLITFNDQARSNLMVALPGTRYVDLPAVSTCRILTASRQITWIRVFQIIPSRIATLIAFEVLQASTCPFSETLKVGKIVITAIQAATTVIAVLGVIRFARTFRTELSGHRVWFKLFSFKAIVGLELVQSIIFTVLSQELVFSPTLYVSYNDFAVGLEQFILIWELLIVSCMFVKSFGWAPYRQGSRMGSVLGALREVVNPMDIIRGLWYATTCLFEVSSRT